MSHFPFPGLPLLGAPPRRGRSHLFTQKVPQRHIGWLAGRSAGEGLGRPAVVPPAGKGRGLDARPCQGAGGERVGRFLRKRRGRCGRLGDRSPTWGTPREVWTERTRSLRVRMKLKRLTGERPSTVLAWHRIAEGNCVAVRRGGEQPEANLSSQSSQTRRLNPIRPIGVASLLRKGEALACW